MKANMIDFAKKFLSMLDVPEGGKLQEFFYAVCEQSKGIAELSGMVSLDISRQERLLCQSGKSLPLKLRTLLKLHHCHSILLNGGCLLEWDEL